MKKKAIKIAAATAIAASAFTAVAPVQSEAAASLTSQIKTAKASIKKPFDTFTKATKLVSSATVNSQVEAAVKAKSSINSAIKKAKLSTKTKNGYYAQIKAYDKYLTYAQNYVKGYDAAKKAQASLNAAVVDLKDSATAGQTADVKSQYTALKTAVANAEKAIAKTVYGSNVRTLLNNQFTKATKTALAGELKAAYNEAVQAEKDATTKAAVEAKVDAYVALANGDLKTQAQVDAAKTAKAAVDLAKLTAVDQAALKVKVDAADVKVTAAEEALKVPAVANVSATNATTLTLTGTTLNKLTAADITVAGNTVSSVTAAADGKTATVVLGSLVTPNVEQKVTVKGTDFKFTYKLVADSAAITASTYDDNRANQYVAFTVNGQKANVADLLANGYSVSFSATDKNATTDQTTNLFANTTTGLLKTGLTAGTDYKVQVTLTNGTNVIVAPVETIKISNLDLAASAINSYEFKNTTGTSTVVQNSTNLVVGETGQFQNLKVLVDGSEQKGLAPTKVEISNKAVASVSVSGGIYTVTANTPGTTTLTITYGNVTKDVTFTVVNAVREVTSLKVTKVGSDTQIYNTTVLKGNNDVTVSPLDQYGDPVTGATVKVESADDTIANAGVAPVTVVAGPDGKGTLTITGAKAGSTTLLFKHNTKNTTLATFGVTVTENAGVATKKFEIVAPKASDAYKKSADNTVDLSDDKVVEYNLNQYNSDGVKIGSADLSTYNAVSTDNTIANPTISGKVLTITGLKKGTATISIKDSVTNATVGTINVTVTDTGATITGVTFKPQSTTLNYGKTVDYKTFLSYTTAPSGLDPVISGITLSKSTTNSIRLNEATGTLYIDQNGDSTYTVAADKGIGQIVLSATSDSTNLTVAGNQSVVADSPTVTKGTLIFKVQNSDPKIGIYAATSLNVDVK